MMDSTTKKAKNFKGQSRVLKICHWCSKKQDPNQKPFQACGRCKEVIYCSKECQVASWSFHKAPCKVNADMKKVVEAQGSGLTNSIANFKRWHSIHLNTLRHAAICALNLGFNPKAVNDNLIVMEVDLKPNHENLPIKKRYTIVRGFTASFEESKELLNGPNGDSLLQSLRESSLYTQQKGGVGVVAVMLSAHNIIDLVKIILPAPGMTRLSQAADNWGDMWLPRLQQAIEED